jgi:hypothetical protein
MSISGSEASLTAALMIIGEVANFAAYAFTDAILVTPLGALTVVIAYLLLLAELMIVPSDQVYS